MDQCLLLSWWNAYFFNWCWCDVFLSQRALLQGFWIINPHGPFAIFKSLLPFWLFLFKLWLVFSWVRIRVVLTLLTHHIISLLLSDRHQQLLVNDSPNIHHSDLTHYTAELRLMSPLYWAILGLLSWAPSRRILFEIDLDCPIYTLELHGYNSLLLKGARPLFLPRSIWNGQNFHWFMLHFRQLSFLFFITPLMWSFSDIWWMDCPHASSYGIRRWLAALNATACTPDLDPLIRGHGFSMCGDFSNLSLRQAEFAESLLELWLLTFIRWMPLTRVNLVLLQLVLVFNLVPFLVHVKLFVVRPLASDQLLKDLFLIFG